MTILATVSSCRRYPVKSMQGLEVAELALGPSGVEGDRCHGVVDSDGHVLSAKRDARLLEAAADDEGLTLPDGNAYRFGDPALDGALSHWLGRPVRLASPSAGVSVGYQMTFDPPDDDAEMFEIPTPPGTFLDLSPVHLLSSDTLAACARLRPDLQWDVRRFRPNLVVDLPGTRGADGFVEDGWSGSTLRIGEALVRVAGPTVRCAMPLRAQPGGLQRQTGIFGALSELNVAMPNHLGVYVDVVQAGTVRPGDAVELVSAPPR